MTLNDILERHTKVLMAVPGVVGTGEGLCKGSPCIKVFVIRKTPDLQERIPKNLDGYPVIIEEIGEIRPLPRKQDQRP